MLGMLQLRGAPKGVALCSIKSLVPLALSAPSSLEDRGCCDRSAVTLCSALPPTWAPSPAGLPQANLWFQATSWPCVSPSAAEHLGPCPPTSGTSRWHFHSLHLGCPPCFASQFHFWTLGIYLPCFGLRHSVALVSVGGGHVCSHFTDHRTPRSCWAPTGCFPHTAEMPLRGPLIPGNHGAECTPADCPPAARTPAPSSSKFSRNHCVCV